MGWELMPLEIGSKKLDGQVNINENNVEIEVPFFKGFKDSDTVKINKKSFSQRLFLSKSEAVKYRKKYNF